MYTNAKTNIWQPSTPQATKQSHCEWNRIVVDVPEQKSEYRLQFSAKNFFSGDSWAIDDLSMTPGCFLGGNILRCPSDFKNECDYLAEAWRAHYIPEYYNFTTCGKSGRNMPSQNTCDNGYNYTAVRVEVNRNNRKGSQKWLAPKSGEYR